MENGREPTQRYVRVNRAHELVGMTKEGVQVWRLSACTHLLIRNTVRGRPVTCYQCWAKRRKAVVGG